MQLICTCMSPSNLYSPVINQNKDNQYMENWNKLYRIQYQFQEIYIGATRSRRIISTSGWKAGINEQAVTPITLLDKYEGSHTTFLHLAVSPSDVTPITLPSSLNSTQNLSKIKLYSQHQIKLNQRKPKGKQSLKLINNTKNYLALRFIQHVCPTINSTQPGKCLNKHITIKQSKWPRFRIM